jgi:hypothetical protein
MKIKWHYLYKSVVADLSDTVISYFFGHDAAEEEDKEGRGGTEA